MSESALDREIDQSHVSFVTTKLNLVMPGKTKEDWTTLRTA